jgi:hypothetical protein
MRWKAVQRTTCLQAAALYSNVTMCLLRHDVGLAEGDEREYRVFVGM